MQFVFLIKSGTAIEIIGEQKRYIGAGQFVPLLDLLTPVHRCTVNAFTDCTVLQIKATILSGILKINPFF